MNLPALKSKAHIGIKSKAKQSKLKIEMSSRRRNRVSAVVRDGGHSSRRDASIVDLNLLWNDKAPKDGRCAVKVLDTVLFKDARPVRWLFTNKNSFVAKKKSANISLSKIRERFLRLATTTSVDGSVSMESKVATVFMSDGTSTPLTRDAFEELISSSRDGMMLHGVAGLQAHMSRQGRNAPVFRTLYDGSRGVASVVQIPGDMPNMQSAVPDQLNAAAEAELPEVVAGIAHFIEGRGKKHVQHLSADFVADDAGLLWLNQFHRIDMKHIPGEESPDKENESSETGKKSSLHARDRPTSSSAVRSQSASGTSRGRGRKEQGTGGMKVSESTPTLPYIQNGGRPQTDDTSPVAGRARRREARQASEGSSRVRPRRGGGSGLPKDDILDDDDNGRDERRSPGHNDGEYGEDERAETAGAISSRSRGRRSGRRHNQKGKKMRGKAALLRKGARPSSSDSAVAAAQAVLLAQQHQHQQQPAFGKKKANKIPGWTEETEVHDDTAGRAHGQDAHSDEEKGLQKKAPGVSEEVFVREKEAKEDAEAKLAELQKHNDILKAKLAAESTANERLTERLQTLRSESISKTATVDGKVAKQMKELHEALKDSEKKKRDTETRESALQRVVSSLEAHVSQLKSRLSAETAQAEREGQRARMLSKKLADQQREWASAMRSKEEAMKREVLAAEERASRQLSEVSGSEMAGGPASPSAKALIRTVEELNKKFVAAQSSWTAKQAELQTQHRLELLKQEEDFQKELSLPRERVRELEDKTQELQSQICVMVKDVSIAKKREEELQRRLTATMAEKKKIEDETKVMQQSMKAMASMGDGGEGANKLQNEQMKVTSAAKIRQLNNEIDFLQAQLSSESKCREDLEKTVSSLNSQFQVAKTKWSKALSEAEESKRVTVRELESRFRQEMLAPRAEIQRLEDKVQELQKSMSDMIKDLALARKQNDSLTVTKEALESERENLAEKVDDLERELDGTHRDQRG